MTFIWTVFVWVRTARRLASARVFQLLIERPSKSTSPCSAARRRAAMPSTVDLPAPLGPMSDVTFPFGISSETSSTTGMPS